MNIKQINKFTNIKKITIMKTNIDFTKDFTMADIISKDFVVYFREYIKALEEEQKICKRDRKTKNHPCPDKRKYDYDTASYKVAGNRWKLNSLYELYYFIKKNKDFDWTLVTFNRKLNYWKEIMWVTPNWIYDYSDAQKILEGRKLLKNRAQLYWNDLIDVVRKYVEDGK